MIHVFLNLEKISKTLLKKAFFPYILKHYLQKSVLVLKKIRKALLRDEVFFLEIGHIGFLKIYNFVLILKR